MLVAIADLSWLANGIGLPSISATSMGHASIDPAAAAAVRLSTYMTLAERTGHRLTEFAMLASLQWSYKSLVHWQLEVRRAMPRSKPVFQASPLRRVKAAHAPGAQAG